MTTISIVSMHDQFHILEGAGDVAKNRWLTCAFQKCVPTWLACWPNCSVITSCILQSRVVLLSEDEINPW